ncbi:MBL fold metallo-hydrolase [Candidatus Pacearchaeota archaeon]|nr:MBL fold metallo-hydrolase [Candidatus Pacearchaeota archaeon]
MEICTIGGYEEVGKNMTAVKIDEDVILFDGGIFLPAVIELQEEGGQRYNEEKMRGVGALPNDLVLDQMGWKDKVRAIVIGHAHLDHVGGIPYLAKRYPKAEILATPFTMEVLKSIIADEKLVMKNKMRYVKSNSVNYVQGNKGKIKIEFVHTTHSTIQCAFIALHSKEGVFFYALDFKFDNYPGIGAPPNYKRFRQLGEKGIKALVVDALYSGTDKKTASERVASHMLEDSFSTVRNKNGAFFVTTFSSHIARLDKIVEFAQKTNRRIVFLGRSLNKYVHCAEKVGLAPFKNKVDMKKYRGQVNSFLRDLEKNRGKYLVVCTGHQAEPGSILDRITQGDTPFKFKKGDNLIFSSSIIPAPVNIAARERMDKKLRRQGVRIQTDVHVSGHAGAEDLRDLIEMLKPEHIIPAHGSQDQETPLIKVASEFGYKQGRTSHLSSNGKLLKI